MHPLLEKEYKYFISHVGHLMPQHRDEFVLIKDRKIAGFYKSYEEALKAGLEQFGNVPFFIKAVKKEEEVCFLTRL